MRYSSRQRAEMRECVRLARQTGEWDVVSLHVQHGAPYVWNGMSDQQARGLLRFLALVQFNDQLRVRVSMMNTSQRLAGSVHAGATR